MRGSHNAENIMAALAVGLARGLSFEQMVPPLCAYRAAAAPSASSSARFGGVDYINDSKATNLDARRKGAPQRRPIRSC